MKKLVPAEVVNQRKEMGREGGREGERETTPNDAVIVVFTVGLRRRCSLIRREGTEGGTEQQKKKKHKLNAGAAAASEAVSHGKFYAGIHGRREGWREREGEYHKI